MPLPYDLKTLRSLQGKIQAIHRFVSQLFDWCHPFNELLNKSMVFEWNEKYQEAFDEIKCYLSTTPILVPPKDSLPFQLYLLMIDFALGIMLAQKNDLDREQSIYYLNWTLIDYELRYIYMECLCLAIIFVVKKLCYYMLNHMIYMIYCTNHSNIWWAKLITLQEHPSGSCSFQSSILSSLARNRSKDRSLPIS